LSPYPLEEESCENFYFFLVSKRLLTRETSADLAAESESFNKQINIYARVKIRIFGSSENIVIEGMERGFAARDGTLTGAKENFVKKEDHISGNLEFR
jgi:hypothetical protein